VLKSGGTSDPPFPAALGLAAVLGLTFFGVRARWIAVVGGGGRTPFSTALGMAAAHGFLLCEGALCCVEVRGDSRTPLVP